MQISKRGQTPQSALLSPLTCLRRASSSPVSRKTQIGITSSEVYQSLLCISQSCFDASPCSRHTPLTRKLDHELKNPFEYREVSIKEEGGLGDARAVRCFIQAGVKTVARYDGSCCLQICVNLLGLQGACQHAGSLSALPKWL